MESRSSGTLFIAEHAGAQLASSHARIKIVLCVWFVSSLIKFLFSQKALSVKDMTCDKNLVCKTVQVQVGSVQY